MTVITETTLSELVQQFLYTKETRNLSAKTLVWYRDLLGSFLKWLEAFGETERLESFGLDQAERYIHHVKIRGNRHTGKELSSQSVHAHVRVLKVFASYLAKREYTDRNVLSRLDYPKTDPVTIRTLSDEEIDRLLRGARSSGIMSERNYCIVWTFLDTGLRLAELAGLTHESVHLDERTLDVLGKGRKRRTVPLGPTARDLMARYAEHQWPLGPPWSDAPFFRSDDGSALSPNAVALTIKRLGKSARVPRLHAHLFRHTFATRYLRENGDMERLRRILGHSDYRMVQRYVHLVDEDLRERHIASPMERFLMQHPVAPPRARASGRRGSRGSAARRGNGASPAPARAYLQTS